VYRRFVGLSTGLSLDSYVHPNLKESAAKSVEAIDKFGHAIEEQLSVYGKRIIG
jgi:hypothetical protein